MGDGFGSSLLKDLELKYTFSTTACTKLGKTSMKLL